MSFTPIELHIIGPRFDAVVTAKSEPPLVAKPFVEPRPSPHHGILAIRTHNPTTPKRVEIDVSPPEQLHSNRFRVIRHHAVQCRAPHPAACSRRKTRGNFRAPIEEANAAKRKGIGGAHWYSEFCQGQQRVRHETFSARLVGRRYDPVGNRNIETSMARRNCRRESRRSSADNEDIAIYHRNSTSSEQNPGPMAATTLHSPDSGRCPCINFSGTAKTDAEERLPVSRRRCQEASNAPSGSCRDS
jgi:hypothetical protein